MAPCLIRPPTRSSMYLGLCVEPDKGALKNYPSCVNTVSRLESLENSVRWPWEKLIRFLDLRQTCVSDVALVQGKNVMYECHCRIAPKAKFTPGLIADFFKAR